MPTLELLTVDGLRWEMEAKREPSAEEFAERVWKSPTLRVRPAGSSGQANWTVMTRHIVAFAVVD